MPKILLIETSTEVCSVGISDNGHVVSLREKRDQKSHASSLALFIEQALSDAAMQPQMLDAVAVSSGPGSYTGLRIGVSTAKGMCYGLNIPLIAVDTLQALAMGFAAENQKATGQNDLIIPMIDARRMEVYAASFDNTGDRINATEAIILNEHTFSNQTSGRIWLLGDGAAKTAELFADRAEMKIMRDFLPSARYMASLAFSAFKKEEFADLAYFEPFYLKDFVAGIPKVKGLK
ncbi:MAG: tRNA (adenosine(37)-N6)-threonylcarbamoyltransferase complex dimerization subunit type 1 TsaB [Bacteroidia bacterium]|nr:tRNA (adenosine(37)-N6)-threonylcarbamoyltransferase complex dimerization subunit type 1 TsaB [Bacteroidia bacterium]